MADMAYIGRAKCGCIRAAFMDEPAYAKDIAKEVASWIRSGLTVERIDVVQARAQLGGCSICEPKHEQTTLAVPE
jgi:hypothetical protein